MCAKTSLVSGNKGVAMKKEKIVKMSEAQFRHLIRLIEEANEILTLNPEGYANEYGSETHSFTASENNTEEG